MWSYLFGQKPKKDLAKKAIVETRTQIDMLQRKEKHLQAQIDEQDAIARKHVTSNKNVAKTALKRKKTHETTLSKIQGQIDALEAQYTVIESANLNFETVKTMKQGAAAMKQIHGSMDIDKVDTIMDDIRDQVALGDEISEAISRPLGQETNDDEIDEELEALEREAETKAERVPDSAGKVVREPAAPQIEEEDSDEEELRKLQAEMAL